MMRIMYISGTRADFGKVKSLIKSSAECGNQVYIVATGMHMFQKYGFTFNEVNKLGVGEVFGFFNSNSGDTQDIVLAKSIQGISDLCKDIRPDYIVVHGDRLEALAGAIVGNFNKIRVIHVEGGEVSGTVDEILRHSISKLSHIHLVANEKAKSRLIQLGEYEQSIFIIGSPEVDTLASDKLPRLEDVKSRYDIKFDQYCIFIFHPVFYEIENLPRDIAILVQFLQTSPENWVVIMPNNDPGSEAIIKEYERFKHSPNVRLLASMRFEYFVSLLKESKLVMGNSSVGVREAPFFGIPSINIGSRQRGRSKAPSIQNIDDDLDSLSTAVNKSLGQERRPSNYFGGGGSENEFKKLLISGKLSHISIEKNFVDVISTKIEEDKV